MTAALLVLSLAALFWFQRNGVRSFRRLGEVVDTRWRQRNFLRRAGRACAVFLGVPVLGLALLGRLDALRGFPREFVETATLVPVIPANGALVGAAIGAVAAGAILGALIALRRAQPMKQPSGMDITPMVPRNRAELLHVVPLVVNAAISEEIFFRAYLPLLLVLLGLQGWAAFAGSALLFGLLHRYQGWLGVLVTTALGCVFTLLYLGSGGLLLPMLFHLMINANALLFRPAMQFRFRQVD